MKKKGFTLIELLAVIVILAIITVIAVPKILDVIEKSRRSSSEQSVKLYVDAFRLYQASAVLNNTDKIPEGTYEVSKETTLNGKTYKKINDLLTMKGNKPSAGTINVTNTGKIGTAKVCINNYVISYQEGSTSILADDCGDMDLFVDFKINPDDWATEKTLTIVYPEKQEYKKYFKVESGSVFIGEKEVTSESAHEVTDKEIKLKLTKNSKVSAWLEKNNKKVGISTYEEKKIDNEKLVEPTITLTGSYPTLTEYGVQMSVSLKLSNETNPTSKIMYRVDNGEFKEYKGEINVTGSKIEAKTVKLNGRESSISEKDMSSVEVAKDAIGAAAYDGDEKTYEYPRDIRYINVDSSVIGKKVKVLVYVYLYNNGVPSIIAQDKDGNEIKTFKDITQGNRTIEIEIPSGTARLAYDPAWRGSSNHLMEISVKNEPVINVTQIYPLIKQNKIEPGYSEISIEYFNTSVQRLYKIDDGQWQIYQNKKINLELDKTIYTKGIDSKGNETKIISYTSSLAKDAIGDKAYDGDEKTYEYPNDIRYINVDSSMIGKKVKVLVYVFLYNKGVPSIIAQDKDGNEIKTFKDITQGDRTIEIEIPSGTARLAYDPAWRGSSNHLMEISILD